MVPNIHFGSRVPASTNGGHESDSAPPAHHLPPLALRAVAVLFGAMSLLSLTFAVLIAFEGVPATSGYFLLGDFAYSGPVAFVVYAAINAVCALGLCMMRHFARWIAIVLLIYSIIQIVPAMSSAIVDDRYQAVIWWGLSIIFRVLALWYLIQPPVCERFSRQNRTT